MPSVKCALCNSEKSADQMLRCNDCGIWICRKCVKTGGFLSTAKYCPKCNSPVS